MDLPRYLARIGLREAPAPDAAGLAALQRAHRTAIPFENFDILLGRGISLDPDAVFDKLVARRRGGYCFEQNQLFARALEALGFEARPLLARVWLFAGDQVPPRTHCLNLVAIDGKPWIADAGFGGGFAPPMRLEDGEAVKGEDGVVHRLIRDPDGWMLARQGDRSLEPQYSFTLDEVFPADLALANHWTASAPQSRFVNTAVASIVLPHGMASLTNRNYVRRSRSGTEASEIASARMLQLRLSLVFGIDLSSEEIAGLRLF